MAVQILCALLRRVSTVAGIQTLDENKSASGIWEEGSIDVIAHVHVLWLDKAPQPQYLGQVDEAAGSQQTSPTQSRPSSMSMSRPATGASMSRPATGTIQVSAG